MQGQSDTVVSFTAALISLAALGFTLYSFWWMNWRKGTLRVFVPSASASVVIAGKMVFHLPIIFFNDGPTSKIIRNLRLRFLQEPPTPPMKFVATIAKVGTDEDRAFATQFPVRGQEAKLIICDFQRNPADLLPQAGAYAMELEGILKEGREWTRLASFSLTIRESHLPGINRLLVHDDIIQD